ncbi:corrinoid ABC transporter permease [Bacillus glycinifermentans]|uniref:ABC transporter permease n=1 Tax=Bacillus glycinifermentans TaxID=1664069 RepID=A0A0J6EHY2_9BACI|nr:iron ABC transporter permease [Bacillus glycinifermentans]ATH93101.1 iron ABC transporter permease [Bacillus glycinifermentans]KMM56219.1 corrinoid ABC transporter permease [Bacillus glycinifermentans]KRT94343.1 ABC transporter permease [Bacillus glycinifermentans]MEC0485874.1 iron ABC transporter permease [Bacillus glycinifermentans]MEC0495700.1 iron ABC transporter permease [Bacillus glycinifermentans]
MRKRFILTYLRNSRPAAYIISLAFLTFSILMGISIGSLEIPIPSIIKVFLQFGFHGIKTDPMQANIIMNIRLPRVILAALVGAALAAAGAAFQGLLKNPLADPYTLGVSSGAAVGAVVTLFFGIQLPVIGGFTLPLLSIAAAVAVMFMVLFFARLVHPSLPLSALILTGIIFSSFLGALISLMIALTGDDLKPIVGWLLGSVSMRGWSYIGLFLPFLICGTAGLLLNARELNVMTYGEEKARLLGVNIGKRKIAVLVSGSILTGAAVAVSGTIGFVGLVVPHMIRLLWGTDHRHLLPLSILNGAGFLVLADLTARTIIEPSELPIGIITALIGAPVFGAILIRRQRGGM